MFELGSKDNKEGTETGAIFAGTGSEVKRSEVKNRANRFDILQEKKKSEALEEKEEENDFFEEGEIKRMRELAKKLSARLMKSKSFEKVSNGVSTVVDGTDTDSHLETKDPSFLKSESSPEGLTDSKDSVQTNVFSRKDSMLPSTSSQSCSSVMKEKSDKHNNSHDHRSKSSDKTKSRHHESIESSSSKHDSSHRHSHHKSHHKHHKKHRHRSRDTGKGRLL